jgi:hypothetical protein
MTQRAIPPFHTFRDVPIWEEYINGILNPLEENLAEYLQLWYLESRTNSHAYPSQGMLLTPFDFLRVEGQGLIAPERMIHILRVRQYFLELFNHPERIEILKEVDSKPFVTPTKISSEVMDVAISDDLAVSVSDLGTTVVGSQNERVARTERFKHGPFVKLGKQARSLLVGSAMPDVYGSVHAISTMAQCLCLVGVPRNGPFSDIKRQVDLVNEVWKALEQSEVLINRSPEDKKYLLNHWRHNIMGVLETEPDRALKRAIALFNAGVRVFRVYSPEPGLGALDTVKILRKKFGDEIELFAGQVVDVQQAQQLEEAGVDGLYIGIGGGGRCITGVRSGSVIDWPILMWKLRGKIKTPVIVEGGASDHIAAALALGASGIGVSRIAGGGTIESPGGMLYCLDGKGEYFKPYGGEASARTKYLDGKMLPFNLPEPTIPYNIHSLTEDIILTLVFRGVKTVTELQAIDPSPLRLKTAAGASDQATH